IIFKCSSWSSEAEARPDGALDNPLYVFPFNQIILDIKPFLHPSPRTPFPKCWNGITYIGARNEAITTEVVVILLFTSGLRLVEKFMHVAEALRARLQPLASHGPNENTCWGPSSSEGPQKRDLTISSKCDI